MGEQRHINRRWNLVVNVLAASGFLSGRVREKLYRLGGIDVNGTQIRAGVWFFSSRITFGRDGMVNSGCYFENREPISIGNRVFLGPQVLLGTSTHQIGSSAQRAGDYVGASLSIGDGCWLGARVTVLPGVAILAGCVIAAGAVVTTDTEPNGLYAGVPARRIRDLPPS